MKAKNNDEKTNSLSLFVYFCMRQMFFRLFRQDALLLSILHSYTYHSRTLNQGLTI